jgi:DNA repair exonuclease SbcCD ATPase subunit
MKIGDLLLLKGYINKNQLHSALSKQADEAINYNRSVPLGKILIEKKYVTIDEVAEALNEQTIKVREVIVDKKEEKVMPTEIGETSKVTFDLKFLATIGVVIVSACATYFSITGQVDDNAKEIDNIKSMGDLKIISYKLEEYDETFKDLKQLNNTLSPLASDLTYIKAELNKLKNKKIDIPEVDLSGIDDCKNKLDALSDKIGAFEERITKLEKRNSGGSRF